MQRDTRRQVSPLMQSKQVSRPRQGHERGGEGWTWGAPLKSGGVWKSAEVLYFDLTAACECHRTYLSQGPSV